MFSFKKIAQETVSLSRLHAGRQQLDTNEIVGQTLTVDEFDLARMVDSKTNEEKIFAVLTFKEKPGFYYNGGFVLTRIIETFAAQFDGDVEAASEAYNMNADNDPVMVRATETKTKNNNNLVSIEIL